MDTIMTGLFSDPATVWFIIGFALLAIEILIFGFASGVLLFGGIGALITGAILWFDVIDVNWIVSIGVFAVASAVATLLLWFPFKKMQGGTELGNDKSSDLIGYQFRVKSDVTHTVPGSHRYSGVQWRVEISDESTQDRIAAGSRVKVAGVDPGVFHVVAD